MLRFSKRVRPPTQRKVLGISLVPPPMKKTRGVWIRTGGGVYKGGGRGKGCLAPGWLPAGPQAADGPRGYRSEHPRSGELGMQPALESHHRPKQAA